MLQSSGELRDVGQQLLKQIDLTESSPGVERKRADLCAALGIDPKSVEPEELSQMAYEALDKYLALIEGGDKDSTTEASVEQVSERLEGYKIVLEALEALARVASGSYREVSSFKSRERYEICGVSITPEQTRVEWGDGHVSELANMWLRDNCDCGNCGAHSSGSRLQYLLDIPDDIRPLVAETDGGSLEVVWSDQQHRSSYDAKWLRDNCNSREEVSARQLNRVLWDSTFDIPVIDFQQVLGDEAERFRLFDSVARYGAAVVEGLGTNPERTEELGAILGYVRETNYGRVFELKMRADAQILADLPKEILPHTDETYRHVPLGINMFHCIAASNEGGGRSILVDSFNVAEQLRRESPEDYRLLTKVPVQHERYIEGENIRSHHPPFVLDAYGELSEVRLNERTMSAITVPPALARRTYDALRRCLEIAYDPSNRMERLLAPGQALVSDNLRVLHGRTGFDVSRLKGERLIRQAQVMRDEFFGRWAHLNEKLRGE